MKIDDSGFVFECVPVISYFRVSVLTRKFYLLFMLSRLVFIISKNRYLPKAMPLSGSSSILFPLYGPFYGSKQIRHHFFLPFCCTSAIRFWSKPWRSSFTANSIAYVLNALVFLTNRIYSRTNSIWFLSMIQLICRINTNPVEYRIFQANEQNMICCIRHSEFCCAFTMDFLAFPSIFRCIAEIDK